MMDKVVYVVHLYLISNYLHTNIHVICFISLPILAVLYVSGSSRDMWPIIHRFC